MLQPTVRRTWAPKGQTPILCSWDRRDRLSAIAVLTCSPKRRRVGLYFSIVHQNIRADDFEVFAAALLKHFPAGVILVIDRWMVHRSGVRRLKSRFGYRMDVEWLPAYSPELNPVEQIWNHSKYSQLANFIPDDVAHLTEVVQDSLCVQSRQPSLLRSFFHCAKLKI